MFKSGDPQNDVLQQELYEANLSGDKARIDAAEAALALYANARVKAAQDAYMTGFIAGINRG
jgi:hypothetical protein